MLKRFLAPAAALALLGGIGAAAPGAAQAATPSCGTGCVNVYVAQLEGGVPTSSPRFVLDAQGQKTATGTPVILFRSSNNDPAEDFTVSAQGTVNDFFRAGLVSASVNLHYKHDEAYELEYAPYGADTGPCAGVPGTAGNGTKVSLQPCGVSADTVWITATGPYSQSQLLGNGYVALINGSDTNFSHPYAMNYPNGSYPTDMPRPQLQTWQVQNFSNGNIYDNELFGGYFGILP